MSIKIGNQYISVSKKYNTGTEETSGITKLYNTIGNNTDGGITQLAATLYFEPTINEFESTSGNISLLTNKFYNGTLVGNTTFVLPEVDETINNQISAYIKVSGNITINFGTSYSLNNKPIEYNNGDTLSIIWKYIPVLNAWAVGGYIMGTL